MDGEQCEFDLEDLKPYVDLSSFRFMLVALSATKIGIATSRYLIIMEEDGILSGNDEGDEENEKIQTVVEFGEVSGCPTSIEWVNASILCVGFETGALTCFNDFGETISEHEFSTCPLVSIRVLPSPDPMSTNQNIWALYENGYLVSVPVAHLLGGPTTLSRYYIRFKLMDVGPVQDFSVLPLPYVPSLFEMDPLSSTTSFVVSGVNPSLSLYTIGGKQHFQHLGKLASYVRDRVGSALSKTVGSALVSFFGSSSASTGGSGSSGIGGGGSASTLSDVSDEDDYTPVSSVLDFQESEKRTILRLSLSPGGKLLAAADTLGRVLLFDTRLPSTAIRVWKGVREARFAWSEDRQMVTPSVSSPSTPSHRDTSNSPTPASPQYSQLLTLAIYAPQMGLLSLWALRHGPCLRSIPVGPQCHIFSALDMSAGDVDGQSRCALLRVTDGSNKISLSLVSPLGHSEGDLDLSAALDDVDIAEGGAEDEDILALAASLERNSEGLLSGHSAVGGASGEPLKSSHLQHNSAKSGKLSQTGQSADAQTFSSTAADDARTLLSVERVVNALCKKASLIGPNAGGNGSVSADIAVAESTMWMKISTLKDVAVLLKCIFLIEKCELEVYFATCGSAHTSTVTTTMPPKPPQDAPRLSPSFSLQFHRNLCRLLQELNTSTSKGGHTTHRYHRYTTWRQQLVKAYENLKECNAQVSLAYTPPPGSEKNKWSGATNMARAEAICWAARHMAPTSQIIRQSMLHSTTATVSTGLSGSPIGGTAGAACGTAHKVSVPVLTSTGSGGRGVRDQSIDSDVQTSSTTRRGVVGRNMSPLRVGGTSSSVGPAPNTPTTPTTTPLSGSTTPTTTGDSSVSPPVSLFLAFHFTSLYLPVLSTGDIVNGDVSKMVSDEVCRRRGVCGGFNYAAIVNLLDALDQSQLSAAGSALSPLCQHTPSVAARDLLHFVFLPLLGDAFALKRFDLAINAMGLGGGGGLRAALPLVLRFLSYQPMAVIFNAMVNRQMSSSPLQRWLRDTLLEFQSFVGGDGEDEESQIAKRSNIGDKIEVGVEVDGAVHGYGPDGNEPMSLSTLLSDVLKDRLTAVTGDRTGEHSDSDNIAGEPLSTGNVGREELVASQAGEYSYSLPMSTDVAPEVTPPSLDEVVRHILRPAWRQARVSLQLECTTVAVAQILEVLEAVSDQIERSSFGDVTLEGVRGVWTTLMRQLRVAMLLSSRAGGTLSVDKLGLGEVSIYALLAADTLCFAQQPDQAAEHELRCQEVYAKRSSQVAGSASAPSASSAGRHTSDDNTSAATTEGGDAGALLAWGPSADSRWKELVTVAEAEDAFMLEALGAATALPQPHGSPKMRSKSSSSSSSVRSSKHSTSTAAAATTNKKIRRRRPLLLFFPSHNQPTPLGAYRAFALVDRWSKRPRRIEVLSLAGAHLLAVPPVTRAAVALRILIVAVFPLLRAYLDLEEGNVTKGSAGDMVQDLVVVMADTELVEPFVQSVAELITFALSGASAAATGNTTMTTIMDATGGPVSVHHAGANPAPVAGSASSGVSYLQPEELNTPVWPPANDRRLHTLVLALQQAGGGVSEHACRWHLGLLWVLQLRTQCGLRGVRTSELMGQVLLQSMCGSISLSGAWTDVYVNSPPISSTHQLIQPADASSAAHRLEGGRSRSSNDVDTHHTTNSSHPSGNPEHMSIVYELAISLRPVREEFLLQCFRRLEAQSSNIVYSVAEMWDIDNKYARLTHLSTLLELEQDDVIGELMNHFDDTSDTTDRITEGIRRRIGTCLCIMERIPACGSLLASLDPSAYAWVRESVGGPSGQLQLSSASASGGSGVTTGDGGVSSAGPSSDLRAVIDGVLKGKVKVVGFDVSSSRHLVVRVQALLFCVPLGNRDAKWTERKGRCDALLSLCSSLSDSEVKAHLKGTGLKLE